MKSVAVSHLKDPDLQLAEQTGTPFVTRKPAMAEKTSKA
jgi:hypothetical protein